MWPFKMKPDLSSDCVSGVFEHSDKNHLWGPWEDVVLESKGYRPWLKEPVTFQINAQERTCQICKYRERREVKSD